MNCNPVIRPANEEDAQEVARLLTLLGRPAVVDDVSSRWSGWSSAGNDALVAVSPEGWLAGLATIHRRMVLYQPLPIGRITALVVDGSVRRQGIGRALVTEAEATLTRAGCGLVEVTSNVMLVDAHAFWERVGYKQTSIRFAKSLNPDS